MTDVSAGVTSRDVSQVQPAAGATSSDLEGIAVVIPAWQPNERLLQLVAALRDGGISRVVLVDDGSGPESGRIFRALAPEEGFTLCRHDRNRGKGRALKTGFEQVLRAMPELRGVVTADADGQHLPVDVVRVARQLAQEPEKVVLGVRGFTGRVPIRSRWGNSLSRQVFRVLTGYRVSDTQTGLRGLPKSVLPELISLPGERYEYESAMLVHLCDLLGLPEQLEIATVYLDRNRGSHFRPLQDSLRVYATLLRACVAAGWQHRFQAHKTKPRLRHV